MINLSNLMRTRMDAMCWVKSIDKTNARFLNNTYDCDLVIETIVTEEVLDNILDYIIDLCYNKIEVKPIGD